MISIGSDNINDISVEIEIYKMNPDSLSMWEEFYKYQRRRSFPNVFEFDWLAEINAK